MNGNDGFCFHSPLQGLNTHTTSTGNKQQQALRIHNPLPLLIKGDDPECGGFLSAHVHPLIRIFYSPYPTTRPTDVDLRSVDLRRLTNNNNTPGTEETTDPRKWYIYLHEFIHLMYFDWTPAKIVAQIYLALCYGCISRLQQCAPAHLDASIWQEFLAWNRRMDQIGKNIRFVEELFAITLAIKAIENQTPTDRRDEWEKLKEEILIQEGGNLLIDGCPVPAILD